MKFLTKKKKIRKKVADYFSDQIINLQSFIITNNKTNYTLCLDPDHDAEKLIASDQTGQSGSFIYS